MIKIAYGLEVLELARKTGEMETKFYPTLLIDEKNVILVDAGLPGQLQELTHEIEDIDVSLDDLDFVIVTHQDMDHIGGIPDILKANPNVEVLAHPVEKPYIQGDEVFDKMTQEQREEFNRRLESMPKKQREEVKAMFLNRPHIKVDKTVEDGEELPYFGGITVIHTPGHTPGHICLYIKQYKTLIAGDALNIADGELVGPNPQHTPNMEDARESLKKLANYNIENVICYHGGVYTGDANRRITELSD